MEQIFLIHGKAGSKTRALVQRLMKSGKKVYAINNPANYDLIDDSHNPGATTS